MSGRVGITVGTLHGPVFSQKFFGNFPITVSKDVIAMDYYVLPVFHKTFHEIEATCWQRMEWNPNSQLKTPRTTQENHAIPELRMKNAINGALCNIGKIIVKDYLITTNHGVRS